MIIPEQQNGTPDIPLSILDDLPTPEEQEKLDYQNYGFFQAGRMGGSVAGLRVCLEKVYFMFNRAIKRDQLRQDELKKPVRIKLEEHKGNIERWENRIQRLKTNDLPAATELILKLKEEKSHIRKHPEELVADNPGKLNFVVGAVIISLLTIYLFVFYSSATYSAFFKEFTAQTDTKLNNSIFDSQAISRSWNDGITQLLLILTVPAVFLGLGFLIHKYLEKKTKHSYWQVAALLLVTLAFDVIIAYEITHKIYEILRAGSMDDYPPYSPLLALQDINFWLIIFAGFVVYVIWGLLFAAFSHAFTLRNKLLVALSDADRRIKEAEAVKADLQQQIVQMEHSVDDTRTEIKKLQQVLDSHIIPREYEHDIYQFMAGWLAWMRGSGRNYQALTDAEAAVREFVKTHFYTEEYVNTNL
ncbi:hypothetical protein JMG10_28260 [Nostoc ellipsosporum NOK]|nr:hypothetical protein [Nostoc ellipsosporum NOK]